MTVCPMSNRRFENNLVFSYYCPCHGVRIQRKRGKGEAHRQFSQAYAEKGLAGLITLLRGMEQLDLRTALRRAVEVAGKGESRYF